MSNQETRGAVKGRITPALVISCVALFAALAGTALALPQNSVRSPQIVDGTIRTVDLHDSAVKAAKIADNAVTNPKLDDNAVTSIEVKDESLNASDLGDASVGSSEVVDQSLAGVDIGPTAVGTSELAAGAVHAADFGSTIVRTGQQAINANSSGGAFINCLATEVRLSGGVVMPSVSNVFLQSSFPNGVNGWTTIVRNNTAAQITVQPYVLCLQA